MKRATAIKATPILFMGLFCVGCLVFYFSLPLVVAFISGSAEQTTAKEAARLVVEVEGVEKINRDAEALLAKYGTNTSLFISPDENDWKDSPAISNFVTRLGSYADLVIIPQSAEVRIRFGSHTHCHFMYIVEPGKIFNAKTSSPNSIQVSSNIFIEQ